MRNLLVVVWLLVGCGCSHSAQAKPQSPRYALIVQEIKGDEDKMVSLRDNQTKRTLWTRKIYYPKATWSQDKRAVALEGGGNLLVWREGHTLRNFGVVNGYDYTMGCAWSPDNQRLLIRVGVSAMSDMGKFGAGRLFCLKLAAESSTSILMSRAV